MKDPALQSPHLPVEILLVEDDPADVRLVKEFLTQDKPHHHIHVVSTGEEALAFVHHKGNHARAPRPDLILLDLNLPLVDGRETLACLKVDNKFKSIPVIVFSSSRTPHDVSKVYDLYANAYIVKPRTLEEYRRVMTLIEEFWLKTAQLPTLQAPQP